MQAFDDLKYSLRLLRKTPGFTATTLVVIILSLSLFLAAFTFGNMLAHEPMPFPHGDDYVRIRAVDAVSSDNLGLYEFDSYFLNRLNESSSYYSEIGAINKGTFVFSDGDFAQSYLGTSISLNLFTALAVNPILGRSFTLEDASPDAERVVMLSERLWRDYYAGDP
ncbi:MAG: ABC transporter permease, partial [Pseudomonadales bacterium]|nr:ABC transporter permease [Pseudomonadales bacterium]